ncbi:DDE-type integrase/transposase/recombinase [Mycobacteroides abscessus subsp. abscessus]|uniref:helix-turn-helix domain-containing protein n=1 Tax=Mycobacteroides abscessus TaxID=36809 RepID=UPI0019D0EBAE|nr:helix-turn-helix domain-containing protein [Mycobacteroides abscessus]MBN7438514.1 DDE-type integrase/transposase/recombinase [Mycobacteroides abscessus subsp. abscessus]
MDSKRVRLGVGTRVLHDGDTADIIEIGTSHAGTYVVLKDVASRHLHRAALSDLMGSATVIDAPGAAAGEQESVAVILAQLGDEEKAAVTARAGHIREVLTGYPDVVDGQMPQPPRPQYRSTVPLGKRYAAKAAELGVTARTIARWVRAYTESGEAGLARLLPGRRIGLLGRVDERWINTALQVMAEHSEQSKPSQKAVIERTNARIASVFGDDVVQVPSLATAYRVLADLEKRVPTFGLSTKRNRDIAARSGQAYGKLRPTRPGEYLLMDTTRLDVFALDPVTLRWVQVELTVAMDWYTRCITGRLLTPVSTKSVDAAAVLYQCFRSPKAGPGRPSGPAWPAHGLPRSVVIDTDAIATSASLSRPIVPETVVVDHGKIYLSDHFTSACQRLGISIQSARVRTGRDKAPVERFFRTLREDLLQLLPGYKGPDISGRGLDVEAQAFFYIDELEQIIDEWIATVYHVRPHSGLVEPGVPGLALSPMMAYEHGVARAGYIEAPRDPDLVYEFLAVKWRTIQHYGIDCGGRRYDGPALDPYRNMTSPYTGKAKGRWPIHLHSDDITRVYFRDPRTQKWHTLMWEHAACADMPLSEDALQFARKLAASKYRYPNDRLAVKELMERWKLSLGTSAAERRIVLRQARDNGILPADNATQSASALSEMTSVAKVFGASHTRDGTHGTNSSAARDTTDAAGAPERAAGSARPDDIEDIDSDGYDTDDDFDVFEDA